MAVRKDSSTSRKAEAPACDSSGDEAAVSGCISNIIQAFTNGLSVFKRLREKRRKRKARKGQRRQEADPRESAEMHLSRSLKRGPQELAGRYDEYAKSGIGQKFAKGDDIAHATLAQTLIKLNTGLVSIITAFLSHDQKSSKSRLDLDYKSLTNLSDRSREEALMSMTQLYQRLSQSQVNLYRTAPISPKTSERSRSKDRHDKEKSKRAQRSNAPVVTRMPIAPSTTPQLVVMRPKATSRKSSSSGTSHSSRSGSGSNSGTSTPLASPLPRYERVEKEREQDRVDSFDVARPTTWPNSATASAMNSPSSHLQQQQEYHYQHQYFPPKLPNFTPTPRYPARHQHTPNQNSHQHSTQHQHQHSRNPSSTSPLSSKPSSPSSPSSPIYKRRLDKPTPSAYTFASDSTKLGEIPQRYWTQPWDEHEAERKNKEAEGAGVVVGASGGVVGMVGDASEGLEGGKKRERKGMFGLFRRKETA